MNRWRVTVRGHGIELRGHVMGDGRLEELTQLLNGDGDGDEIMVLASMADEVDGAQT